MLSGFAEIQRSDRTAWVREPWSKPIADALIDGAGCSDAGVGGRGELLQFSCDGGVGIIRQYRRGGFVRHFVSDIYLLDNRACKELSLLWALFQEGLPVPEPLGAAWQRIGPFIRGWIATRRLDAVELGQFLEKAALEESLRRCRACGALIRRMHDLGVNHPDLQLGNILVSCDAEYLIDFDKAVRIQYLSERTRDRNLRRLRRSFLKHAVSVECFSALREGYDCCTA